MSDKARWLRVLESISKVFGRQGEILQVVFIVLKITGLVSWSWWWITAPTWIALGFAAVILAFAGVIAIRAMRTIGR